MTTKGKDAKRKDSREKGARGEREAARYLTETLGFLASRMGRNGYSDEDLRCRDCPVLSKVWIEVKRDESFDLHRQSLEDACEQAAEGAGVAVVIDGVGIDVGTTKPWAVLWRRNRSPWRLTFVAAQPPLLVTVTGDDRIRESLKWLAGTGGGGE
jgi:hypothetical protein